MKIGMRPTEYTKAYGDKGFYKMAEHGFECIDYQSFIAASTDFFKLDMTAFEKALLKERGEIEREGLFVHQAHAPFGFPIKDGTVEERAERFEEMRKSVYGTAVLGAKTLVMHPLSPFTLECPDPAEETAKINADFITRLAEYARDFGITVCVENLPFPFYSLSHCEAVNKFVRSLDIDNVKICLDIGHTHYLSYVKTQLGVGRDEYVPCSAEKAVRLFADMLHTCHIHQNYGDTDAHAPLDEGNIDIKAFSDALLDIGYNGVYSLEIALHFDKHPESEWDAYGKHVADTARKYAKK